MPTEGHEQNAKQKLVACEQGPAGRRKLPMAGLAFEHLATPVGIDGCAAASGTDRSAIGVWPPHPAEHLMGRLFRQIAQIDQRQGPHRRGHKKMLRHGSSQEKQPWHFFTL